MRKPSPPASPRTSKRRGAGHVRRADKEQCRQDTIDAQRHLQRLQAAEKRAARTVAKRSRRWLVPKRN